MSRHLHSLSRQHNVSARINLVVTRRTIVGSSLGFHWQRRANERTGRYPINRPTLNHTNVLHAGLAKVGKYCGGGISKNSRFLRASCCPRMPASPPSTRGNIGLVPSVSLFCLIASRSPSTHVDQASNIWSVRIKRRRHHSGDDNDEPCHIFCQLAFCSCTTRAVPFQGVCEVVEIW